MGAIVKLAENPEMQEAWAAAPRVEPAPATEVFDQATVSRPQGEMRNLESEQERLLAEVVAETACDGGEGEGGSPG